MRQRSWNWQKVRKLLKRLPADPDVKNYSYTIVDGEVYFRENSVMMRPKLNRTAQERVKSMVALRDTVYRLMDAQLEDADDETIENEQRELNRQYDAFSAKFGLINDRANRLAFSDDSSYYLLSSLEVLDEDRKLERKADMFTKRTIRRPQAITHTDTAAEALAVSIGEKARVDLPYMAELTGKNEDTITKELTGVIYFDPESQTWQTARRISFRQCAGKTQDSAGCGKREYGFYAERRCAASRAAQRP